MCLRNIQLNALISEIRTAKALKSQVISDEWIKERTNEDNLTNRIIVMNCIDVFRLLSPDQTVVYLS